MGSNFEVSLETTINATPEEVWEAIATGPGLDSWFMGHNEVEPREGGTATMAMGDLFTAESTVTAWDPPRRIKTESAPAADGSFMAMEYLVEGRGQGSTVVRLVHSGFLPGDNWEEEYDALRKGNPLYLASLRQYVEHFRGRTATPVNTFGAPQASEADAWRKITSAVGLGETVTAGDPVRFTVDGTEYTGVVDTVRHPSFLGIRTGDALLRFVGRGGLMGVGHHLFDQPDAKTATETWQAWLGKALA
jgi:uncharacterized protein YndB with AHSA1/START domain